LKTTEQRKCESAVGLHDISTRELRLIEHRDRQRVVRANDVVWCRWWSLSGNLTDGLRSDTRCREANTQTDGRTDEQLAVRDTAMSSQQHYSSSHLHPATTVLEDICQDRSDPESLISAIRQHLVGQSFTIFDVEAYLRVAEVVTNISARCVYGFVGQR
jgi:hypothetical protein